jgi:hypothetical protein
MKTDELIERLGREATLVTPLPAPGVRTTMWLVWGVIYLVVVAAMISGVSMSPGGAVLTPLYLLQQGAALVTGITAARAAFVSVVPGASNRVRLLPVISGAVWAVSLLWGGVLDVQTSGTLGITSQTDWPCVVSMTIGGVVLMVPMLMMLRRGAPLTPHTTVFLGGLAALSLANIEACLTRPHAFAMTVLLWHGVTVAIAAALFAWIGRRCLCWPSVIAH